MQRVPKRSLSHEPRIFISERRMARRRLSSPMVAAPRRGLPAATPPCPPSTATPALHPRPPKPDVARAAQKRLGWPRTAPSAHLRYRRSVSEAPRASICPTRRTRLIAKRPSRPRNMHDCVSLHSFRSCSEDLDLIPGDLQDLSSNFGNLGFSNSLMILRKIAISRRS